MDFAELMRQTLAGYGNANRSEVVYVPNNFGLGFRADADPLAGFTRVNEVLQGYILRSTPASDVDVHTRIFPVKNVTSYLFQYGKTHGEELVLKNTERTAKAQISLGDSAVEEIVKRLRRYTYAWAWDEDTIMQAQQGGADAWNLQFMGTEFARQIVLRWLDKLAADIINTTAGNSVYGLVQAGGAWSTAGTMLAEVNAAAEYLTSTTGRFKDQFTLLLFNTVVYLAQRDPQFVELRSRVNGATTATNEEIARYLGIGRVETITTISKTSQEADPSYLFPSHAVLCYQGSDAEMNMQVGGKRWGQTFRWGVGAALNPYYIPDRTTWAYPFQMRETIEIIDPTCAVAITSPT